MAPLPPVEWRSRPVDRVSGGLAAAGGVEAWGRRFAPERPEAPWAPEGRRYVGLRLLEWLPTEPGRRSYEQLESLCTKVE